MKKISKLTYLLGLPALIGLSLLYSMNVAVGEISISIPSSMNLHRPQLWSLVLGSTGTQAIVEVNTGKNVLTIRNGLIMGRNNGSLQGARYVSIGGGVDNTISSVENSGIGGGNGNLVDSAVSVIGGGSENRVKADSKFNTVAGGYSNLVANEGSIVGGENNVVIGRSVVVGGSGNHVDGDGSMAFGSESKGGARSFSWNSPIVRDYSAIIVATGGVLIGTYYPVTGVNLVVEGAVKIGTGLLTENVGEIRMQSGCFYGYDGRDWHVINKGTGVGCPKISCTFGSVLLRPNQRVFAYTQSYSMDCSHVYKPVICNEDGTLGDGRQYYPYCYNLTGGIWYTEEMAQCGTADGGTYVNSPTMTDGLCANGTPGDIDTQNTLFAWQCSVGTSVANCSATRTYSCNGEQPTGPGVIPGNSVQVYSDTLKSWTPVAQGESPGVCQWTCAEGYNQVGNGCSGDVINELNDVKDLDMYFITDEGTTGHYTLMDRNLGATAYMDEPGKTTGDWYGSYYQWGNNYGFPNQGDVNTSRTMVDATGYGPDNPYSSDTFIMDISWSTVRNGNLWGDIRNTDEARQGPCPSRYHVPTINEFDNITHNYWQKSVNDTGGTYRALDSLMPFAGRMNNVDTIKYGQDFYGNYWSSTPSDNTYYPSAYMLDFGWNGFGVDDPISAGGYGIRGYAHGGSVRCFKNTPNSNLTIHPNGGTGALIIVHNNIITKLGTPSRGTDVFEGWYSDSSFTPASQVRTGDSVSTGTHLYAKWEGENNDMCNGVPFSYGEITICNPENSSECLTMMDRNLGACVAGTGEESYGNYYQWGNNYGFHYSLGNNVPVETVGLTWNDSYNNNGYLSEIWINHGIQYTNADVWSDSSHHDGIWGGVSDNISNGRGYTGGVVSNLAGRKGPCPNGWHVPSAGEWSLLIKFWRNSYYPDVGLDISDKGLYYLLGGNSNYLINLLRTEFANYFKLPFAGYRQAYDASFSNQGSSSFYWSSSPEGENGTPQNGNMFGVLARNFRIKNVNDVVSSRFARVRGDGLPVRCFKNN